MNKIEFEVYLCCFSASFLYYILSRAIGIESSIYGISSSFTTKEVKTMGSNEWKTYHFDRHQADERGTNIYDATIHFRDKSTDHKGYAVVNISKIDYKNKLTDESISGNTCADPALLSIIYQ